MSGAQPVRTWMLQPVKLFIIRHKKRSGFGGTITVTDGVMSCCYKIRVMNHPHHDDSVSLDQGDWSSFRLEICRGSKRRREIIVDWRGEELMDDGTEDDEVVNLTKRLLLQWCREAINEIHQRRREQLNQPAGDVGFTPRLLTRSSTREYDLANYCGELVVGRYNQLERYLLGVDAWWRR